MLGFDKFLSRPSIEMNIIWYPVIKKEWTLKLGVKLQNYSTELFKDSYETTPGLYSVGKLYTWFSGINNKATKGKVD